MEVLRMSPNGAYLNGEDLGEILLPNKFVTQDVKPGATIEAFVYLDSEDRLTATIQHPYTEINHFAYLECVAADSLGAFRIWVWTKICWCQNRSRKTDSSSAKNTSCMSISTRRRRGLWRRRG